MGVSWADGAGRQGCPRAITRLILGLFLYERMGKAGWNESVTPPSNCRMGQPLLTGGASGHSQRAQTGKGKTFPPKCPGLRQIEWNPKKEQLQGECWEEH